MVILHTEEFYRLWCEIKYQITTGGKYIYSVSLLQCERVPLFEPFYRKAGLAMCRKPGSTGFSAFCILTLTFPKYAKHKTNIFYTKSEFRYGFPIKRTRSFPQTLAASCSSASDGDAPHCRTQYTPPRSYESAVQRCSLSVSLLPFEGGKESLGYGIIQRSDRCRKRLLHAVLLE